MVTVLPDIVPVKQVLSLETALQECWFSKARRARILLSLMLIAVQRCQAPTSTIGTCFRKVHEKLASLFYRCSLRTFQAG